MRPHGGLMSGSPTGPPSEPFGKAFAIGADVTHVGDLRVLAASRSGSTDEMRADVENARLRIDRRALPVRSAGENGSQQTCPDCRLPTTEGGMYGGP